MTLRRALAAALCCVAVAAPAWAASIEDLERQLRAVVEQRKASEQARARLMTDAAALSEGIAALQREAGPRARASRPLEQQLRQFDRIVAQLDAADRKIKEADTAASRLRTACLAEIDREMRGLDALQDPLASASRSTALEAVRRRIDELAGPRPAFRPLLIVGVAPDDTVADLDRKVAVLAAERSRGTSALTEMDRELAVLSGRVIATRHLLDELETAARGAPQDLRLVQRQVDEVQRGLHEIEQRRDDLQRVRETVVKGLADIEKRVNDCDARRRALTHLGQGVGA